MIKNSSPSKAHIASVALAAGPYIADQAFAQDFMETRYGGKLSAKSMSFLRAVFSHPGVRQRRFAFDSPECLVDEDPDSRVARFTRWSVDLSAQAATQALAKAGVGAGDVAGIVVNTCTGYICPGISTYLIEKLGLPRNTRAYDLVGSGCGGAIPNLQVAEAMLATAGNRVMLCVSVEICSATFQMDNDASLILSNALFGDGAAAAVLWNRPEGFELAGSAAQYAPEQRDAVRFVHKHGFLHNQLSPQLPQLAGQAAAQAVGELLAAQGLGVADVAHWALHTGGEKIINAVRDAIGIPEAKIQATRKILEEYGNMSSPTVWFVLDEILKNGIKPGDWCVMIAYGAGLSAHAALIRKK
ncbi:MAG: type III polyketide synthase [Candidatus Sumerlaeota bacterium]|nr:type III polyketide synthase [Candidatus Sumerlaeota bacterium]